MTNMYPTADDPAYGAFVASQMRSVEEAGAEVRIEFVNGRLGPGEYWRAIGRIRRMAQSGQVDLVHAHYGLTGFVAAFQPLPLVVSFCGDDLLGTPNGRGSITMKSRLIRRLSWFAARRAAAIICKSDELRAALPRERDRSRASVIPNGVDTVRFRPGDRAAARRRLELSLEERLVLFPSTPTEVRKRLDLAQAAVDLLRADGMPVRLWIVQRVPHEEMPLYYQAADCLLLTSDWEGSPNALKEALCCDLPVVTVDAGDAREWLGLTTGCALVERSPTQVAGGLLGVLSKVDRVDGREVRELVSLPRIAQRLLQVYEASLTPPRLGGSGPHSHA